MSAADVQWSAMEHAFGCASDVPAFLRAVSRARGGELHKRLRELCERVLHQGTIYSASPAVVRELIAIAATREGKDKALLYGALDSFAGSARDAIGAGSGACCGGSPADGAAILREIRDARVQFASDLHFGTPEIRAFAAALLTPEAEADEIAVQFVRERYFIEPEAAARLSMIEGLARAHGPDWREFLHAALERETAPANRCALRRAETREWKTEMPPAAIEELIAISTQSNEWQLFGALRELGSEREIAALLQALESAADPDFLREIAERLLRLVFDDRRSGWEQVSYSLASRAANPPQANAGSNAGLNLGASADARINSMFFAAFKMLLWLLVAKTFPFLMRWKLSRIAKANVNRVKKVDYWGLKGAPPELPPTFTPGQQEALRALARKKELWRDSTNLWTLFGLPDNAAALRIFVDARA